MLFNSLPVLEAGLDRLDALAHRKEVPVIGLMLRPMVFSPEDFARHEPRIEALHAAFDQRGLPLIDTTPAFTFEDRALDLIIYPGDAHPNAVAHRRLARWIDRELGVKLTPRGETATR